MTTAVFDANLLISAFLSRQNPGGASRELLHFVIAGAVDLYLSVEIIDEAIGVLLTRQKLQQRYRYSPQQVGQYRADLLTLAHIVHDPPHLSGIVRDPDDDKIIACAVAVGADYIVTRDHDLLSLKVYSDIDILTPESFLAILRAGNP